MRAVFEYEVEDEYELRKSFLRRQERNVRFRLHFSLVMLKQGSSHSNEPNVVGESLESFSHG
jgi:hypothetical protein